MTKIIIITDCEKCKNSIVLNSAQYDITAFCPDPDDEYYNSVTLDIQFTCPYCNHNQEHDEEIV